MADHDPMLVAELFVNVPSNQTERYRKIFTDLAKTAYNKTGCLRYEFYQDINDEKFFRLFHEWKALPAFVEHMEHAVTRLEDCSVHGLNIRANADWKAEKFEAAMTAIKTLREAALKEKGCIGYEVCQNQMKSLKTTVFESFKDVESFLHHIKTDHAETFQKTISDLGAHYN